MRLQGNATIEDIYRLMRTLTACRLAALESGDDAAAGVLAARHRQCVEDLARACEASGPAQVHDVAHAA